MITLKCQGCDALITVQAGNAGSEPIDGHYGQCMVCNGHCAFNEAPGQAGGGGSAHADGGQAQGGEAKGGEATMTVQPVYHIKSLVIEQFIVPADVKIDAPVKIEEAIIVKEDTTAMTDNDFAAHIAQRRRQLRAGNEDSSDDGG